MKQKTLHFDVSSGLKSVLGSDLITDDEVAIFELVKNSFDASAKRVDIDFSNDAITLIDNGHGMSFEDIQNKWLFVAYSEKKGRVKEDYRKSINEHRHFAGSKGIGRFSSDRLGQIVKLQTRAKSETAGAVHRIEVNWDLFDSDPTQHFEKINVQYGTQTEGFIVPNGLPKPKHGTIISIEHTRRHWNRDSILRLKSALAKLINPFGAEVDGFRIRIHAAAEIAADEEETARHEDRGEIVPPNMLVNGDVGNFIFSTLRDKTTFIEVHIDESGKYLESSLTDRGELIYEIREPNVYEELKSSGFKCQVYFLNQSAKLTFARRMGVPSVQFGSVFLFRNGFRAYPIGNEGDDWFGMDRRKQQGYKRFLGSRDVIGRIDVSGSDRDFQESSSRNTGLIETRAVQRLRKCFIEHCLKRLERYVVPVTFVDREDKNTSDTSRLLTDPGKARVASVVAKLVDSDDVELIRYSTRLIGILNERSDQFHASLASLRAIAEKTGDANLYKRIEEAETRYLELRRSEEEARRQADDERRAKEAAEARAQEAERTAAAFIEKLDEEKKRNLFLTSISNLDTETILNLHHQVTIYAVDLQQQIENFLVKTSGHKTITVSQVFDVMERISLLNRKVLGISKFATKANFRLESEKIKAPLGKYIEEYITGVARDFLLGPMKVGVSSDNKGFVQTFKPIDVSVVIDNLVSNAKKARATKVTFSITHPEKDTIHILVEDNGKGFHKNIDNPERVFEKGFTMTDGSGLGLYHVRHVLGEMKGTIQALNENGNGASFLIKISK